MSNRTFTQTDLEDLAQWLNTISIAPESEAVESFITLTEIAPLPIIRIAKKRLSEKAQLRIDKLTDYSLC